MPQYDPMVIGSDRSDWQSAKRWAAAFLAGFQSAQTRKSYGRDLHCWFDFCAAHRLHPYRGVRRTHLEVYLRYLETLVPAPAAGTRYRREATLSSWFRWLEDENVTVGNPPHGSAARSVTAAPAVAQGQPARRSAGRRRGRGRRRLRPGLSAVDLSPGAGHLG